MLASFIFYSMNNSLEAFFKTGLTFSWRTPGWLMLTMSAFSDLTVQQKKKETRMVRFMTVS